MGVPDEEVSGEGRAIRVLAQQMDEVEPKDRASAGGGGHGAWCWQLGSQCSVIPCTAQLKPHAGTNNFPDLGTGGTKGVEVRVRLQEVVQGVSDVGAGTDNDLLEHSQTSVV